MLTNWHRTEYNLKNRRQELMAEAEQYRLARLSQSAQPRLNFNFVRRMLLRLKIGSASAQPRLEQRPAA